MSVWNLLQYGLFLPAGLTELWIRGLPVGEGRIDLSVVRHRGAIDVNVLRHSGAVDVVVR
jgi:hypothetical protein